MPRNLPYPGPPGSVALEIGGCAAHWEKRPLAWRLQRRGQQRSLWHGEKVIAAIHTPIGE